MKLLIFFGIVGLIHGLPLTFNINGGLTGKPFPITRGALGAANKGIEAVSRPIENAQFSFSSKSGGNDPQQFVSDSSIKSARSYDNEADLAELFHRQNANAHYSFSTDIKDQISDLTQARSEVRDGLKVRGHYSYSDGYTRYIVHYVADENGYRVEKQESVKLDGPNVNPLGTAQIDAKSNDIEIRYGVRGVPIENGTQII